MNRLDFPLETERLFLLPLTARQLRLWAEDIPTLERELSCRYCAEPMEGIFLQIVRGQLEKTEHDSSRFCFHSFWLLIRKADRVVVGSADFKATPDTTGAVEIGYGLGAAFEGQGYMTEAVKAMCGWAFTQSGVTRILAETDADGIASRRVLVRCGFQRMEQDSTQWWQLQNRKIELRQEEKHRA